MQLQQRFQLSPRKSSGMVGPSEFYQDGERNRAFIFSHLSVIRCEFPMKAGVTLHEASFFSRDKSPRGLTAKAIFW